MKALIFLGGRLAVLALFVGSAALIGWLLMLVLGIAHHDLHSSIPALGFWTCAALTLLIRLVWFGLFGRSGKS